MIHVVYTDRWLFCLLPPALVWSKKRRKSYISASLYICFSETNISVDIVLELFEVWGQWFDQPPAAHNCGLYIEPAWCLPASSMLRAEKDHMRNIKCNLTRHVFKPPLWDLVWLFPSLSSMALSLTQTQEKVHVLYICHKHSPLQSKTITCLWFIWREQGRWN